jgi:CRP-like cAMP-binding protein
MDQFWTKVETYSKLSSESKKAWQDIIKRRIFEKDEFFVLEGDEATKIAFVIKGLFSQFHTTKDGDTVIKRFFFENFFVASASSMLTGTPSLFSIKAIERSEVLEYEFKAFRKLTERYPDIAQFYMRYMEVHWIIEKEPLEISLRYDTAKKKYAHFLQQYPSLESRLKQHEVAAYFGITPTQLSRIRAELDR